MDKAVVSRSKGPRFEPRRFHFARSIVSNHYIHFSFALHLRCLEVRSFGLVLFVLRLHCWEEDSIDQAVDPGSTYNSSEIVS